MKIHSIKLYKQIRRNLRKNMTKAEVVLWSQLKNQQLGYKFRRQHSIGRYIVDFYSPQVQLVVELDGRTHDSDQVSEKDKKKQKYLERLGFTVKRYSNYEIFYDLKNITRDLQVICQLLDKNRPSS